MIEVFLCAKQGVVKDPFGLTYDITNRQWSNSQYALKYNANTDIEDVMTLVKQVYKNSKNN